MTHLDPLVAPAESLNAVQRERASRQISLPGFGEIAQRRLQAASVLVIGAGGLGSASVPYLAGAGIGRIGIIDDDVVELSNLHRQVAHGTSDIGRPKVDSLADAVRELNPEVQVETHNVRLTSQNAFELMRGYDLVLDGSDNFPTRYLVADAAELLGVPLVWGSILQFHGQVGVSWRPHAPGYRDLFPTPPPAGEVLDCGTGGVLPGLCGTIGLLLATEVMKLITGTGQPLYGRVLVYDSLAARTRELEYAKDPTAQTVTELIDYDAFCAGGSVGPKFVSAEELVAMIDGGNELRLLDVRNPDERVRLNIPGSYLLPLPELEGNDVTVEGPVIVYCERDPRSVRAADILVDRGSRDVLVLQGGIRRLAQVAPHLLESGVEA